MILWSSKELERALAGGELDPWTKVKYVIVPAVIGSLSVPSYVFRPIYGERTPGIDSLFTPIIAFAYYAMLTNSIRRLGRLLKAQQSAGA